MAVRNAVAQGIAYNRATLSIVAMSTHSRRHPRAWHAQNLSAVGHAGRPSARADDAMSLALAMSRSRFAATRQQGDGLVVATRDPCDLGAIGVRVQGVVKA